MMRGPEFGEGLLGKVVRLQSVLRVETYQS
jgi:hypothetical protein